MSVAVAPMRVIDCDEDSTSLCSTFVAQRIRSTSLRKEILTMSEIKLNLLDSHTLLIATVHGSVGWKAEQRRYEEWSHKTERERKEASTTFMHLDDCEIPF